MSGKGGRGKGRKRAHGGHTGAVPRAYIEKDNAAIMESPGRGGRGGKEKEFLF